jgi:hypothetical protein
MKVFDLLADSQTDTGLAEKIAHVLAPLSDPGVMGIRRKAGA